MIVQAVAKETMYCQLTFANNTDGERIMPDFKVYANEPSIIHEFSMTDCPADILPDYFGEICTTWLRKEHPKCTFVYEPECCTLLLDGGHGLSGEQIRMVQTKATAFVCGLMHGAEIARRPKRNAPLRRG